MAVAGEVSLGMYGSVSSPLFVFDNTLIFVSKLLADEHGLDFDKYGILIKVKFR